MLLHTGFVIVIIFSLFCNSSFLNDMQSLLRSLVIVAIVLSFCLYLCKNEILL